MAISLRLNRSLELELTKYARDEGKSKSDLVRSLIADFVSKKANKTSAWELGKDKFGRFGSGRGNLSIDRKRLLKKKINAKKNRS